MNEDMIRSYFSRNWAFRLVSRPLKVRLSVIIGIPLMIFLAGAIVAAFLGVFDVFILNPLAYGGPLTASVAFVVFSWYAVAFPRILLNVYPAMENQEKFEPVIKQWADLLMNRAGFFVLVAIPIIILNIVDLAEFWTNSRQIIWPGSSWAGSSQPIFFALYYGLFSVLATALILCIGAVTIIASVIILFQLLNTPIKLAYFRQLRSVGDLSIGLSLWTFIPVVLTVGAMFLKESPTTAVMLSGTLQSLMVATILLVAFIGPILIARQAIIDAKFRRFVEYEHLQDQNYAAITNLIGEPCSGQSISIDENVKVYDQLRVHLNHVDIATEATIEIDSIPNWPISLSGAAQLVLTGIIPLLGFILALFRK